MGRWGLERLNLGFLNMRGFPKIYLKPDLLRRRDASYQRVDVRAGKRRRGERGVFGGKGKKGEGEKGKKGEKLLPVGPKNSFSMENRTVALEIANESKSKKC